MEQLLCLTDAEALGVWVAGWLVANMYTHTNENGPVEAGKLLIDLFIADRVAASQPWILMITTRCLLTLVSWEWPVRWAASTTVLANP